MGKTIDFIKYVDKKTSFGWAKVEAVIYWLARCGVLGLCSRAVECDFSNLVYGSRLYYKDMGLASYCYGQMAKASEGNINGAVAENFAYLELDGLDRALGAAHVPPVFGTWHNGEIDFLAFSKKTSCTYGIDAKCAKGSSRTAIRLLREGILDYVVYARANTTGGFGSPGTMTIPIYLLQRFDFDTIYTDPSAKPSKRRQEFLESTSNVDDISGNVILIKRLLWFLAQKAGILSVQKSRRSL
jgi:hypothetical protein